MIGIVLASTGHFPYADAHVGALLLGNLLTAIMMRNELFLRVLYFLANHLLAKVCLGFLHPPFQTRTLIPLVQWPPLSVRLGVTSALQHLGGIHSGCATSGLAWILYKVVGILKNRSVTQHSVMAMGLVTNIAIIISVVSAFPWVRNAHHK